MGKLSGETVLITGGARGLGRAYALHLAGLGANVGIIDIDLKSYEEFEAEKALQTADTVMDEVRALGVRSFGVEADVSDYEQVSKAVSEITGELGDISVLICNAGGGLGRPLESRASTMDLAQYRKVIDRNLHGTVYTVTAVAPVMKKNKKGKIITVSSHAGQAAFNNGTYAHYAIAKAGILHYTRLLAHDLGGYNINVNCISPGFISTGRLEQRYEEGRERYLSALALKRFGTPEDCAKAVEFLATDMSDYVTGTVVEVTGGTLNKVTMID